MQFDQKRRSFITLLGSAAAWPLAARAQQPGKTPRVGYIRAGTPRNDPFREEFVRGMRDLGYVEGRNIAYEFRHYGDDVESIPSLIGDLLRAKVDIIVVGGTAAIRAAQSATQSIPIVMGAAADPLGTGLVPGLAHPDRRAVRLSPIGFCKCAGWKISSRVSRQSGRGRPMPCSCWMMLLSSLLVPRWRRRRRATVC